MSEKKKISPKLVFAIRLILFVVFAIGAPIGHIMAKYKPFEHVEKISIGFMGGVVFLILVFALRTFVKFYLDGMKTKYSFLKQIIDGVYRVVLPLIIAFGLIYFFKSYAEQLLEVLLVLIPCETLAIIVNPLPKWAFNNNVDGLGEIVGKIGLKKEDDSK